VVRLLYVDDEWPCSPESLRSFVNRCRQNPTTRGVVSTINQPTHVLLVGCLTLLQQAAVNVQRGLSHGLQAEAGRCVGMGTAGHFMQLGAGHGEDHI